MFIVYALVCNSVVLFGWLLFESGDVSLWYIICIIIERMLSGKIMIVDRVAFGEIVLNTLLPILLSHVYIIYKCSTTISCLYYICVIYSSCT